MEKRQTMKTKKMSIEDVVISFSKREMQGNGLSGNGIAGNGIAGNGLIANGIEVVTSLIDEKAISALFE